MLTPFVTTYAVSPPRAGGARKNHPAASAARPTRRAVSRRHRRWRGVRGRYMWCVHPGGGREVAAARVRSVTCAGLAGGCDGERVEPGVHAARELAVDVPRGDVLDGARAGGAIDPAAARERV